MKLAPSLKILNKFNRETLTDRDFLKLCRLNNITVTITPDTDRGFYYSVNRKHFIVIASELSPERQRFVKWHEFAHFLQNFKKQETAVAFLNLKPDEASEKLADVFAAIAIDPNHVTICDRLGFIGMLIEGEESK